MSLVPASYRTTATILCVAALGRGSSATEETTSAADAAAPPEVRHGERRGDRLVPFQLDSPNKAVAQPRASFDCCSQGTWISVAVCDRFQVEATS